MAGKRLLILGGGFAGLDVARAIGRSRAAREYWDTLLIDKENFFQFNPLLPAVAVGAVETRHIVYPLRQMARHRHIHFHKNKVTRIDLQRREVHLHNDLSAPYDALVIAVGSVSNYYSVPGAPEHSTPFKTIVDAMKLRARVVELFEMAEQAETLEQRRRLLAFAIAGGGVTGVEVAAELIEMTRETLLPRYPSLHASDVSVTVVEAGERLVPSAIPNHSEYIHRYLERRGVNVILGAPVSRVEEKRLHLKDGRSLDAFTIVWTAGVHPPPIVSDLPVRHHRDGRVIVDDHLRAVAPDGTSIEDVFVLGDCAASLRPDGTMQPALSQTAIAMGAYVGEAARRTRGDANAEAVPLQGRGLHHLARQALLGARALRHPDVGQARVARVGGRLPRQDGRLPEAARSGHRPRDPPLLRPRHVADPESARSPERPGAEPVAEGHAARLIP